MSDLRPSGIPLTLGGREYRLLFTIAAIDEIQAACNLPLSDVIECITKAANGDESLNTLVVFRTVLRILLSEAAGEDLTDADVGNMVTRQMYRAVAWVILAVYMESMPEKEDEEDDEDDEEPKDDDRAVNTARLIYIGCKILNYTETEIFQMTLRKFYLIYDEHLELNGIKKKEDESLLDVF